MKSNLDSTARKTLKAAKLYRTECRTATLKVLLKISKPLSQGQIALRLDKSHFNKATIYRTLESFCEVGLVHKVFVHKRAVHFELADRCTAAQCHPHFTCKSCGATRCLTGLSVPIVEGLKEGFVIHRQQIRLEGLCPLCA